MQWTATNTKSNPIPNRTQTLNHSRSNCNYNQTQCHQANVIKLFIHGSVATKLRNRLDGSVATSFENYRYCILAFPGQSISRSDVTLTSVIILNNRKHISKKHFFREMSVWNMVIFCHVWMYVGARRMSESQNTARATLLQQLTSKIRFSGPITVADYMKEVLTNSVGVRFLTY